MHLTTVQLVSLLVFLTKAARSLSLRSQLPVKFAATDFTSKAYTRDGVVSLPLTDNRQWYVSAPVSFGTPPQSFDMIIDLAWGDTYVPSVECKTKPKHTFNASHSSTFVPSDQRVHVDLGYPTSGFVAQDIMHVGDLHIVGQEFELADSDCPDALLFDGPLGFALDVTSTSPGHTSVFKQSPFRNMIDQRLLDRNVFSIKWPKGNSSNGGELMIGGINQDLYTGELVTLTIVDRPVAEPTVGYRIALHHGSYDASPSHRQLPNSFFSGGWQVEASSVSLGSGKDALYFDLHGYVAGFNTLPWIFLPGRVVDEIIGRLDLHFPFHIPCDRAPGLPDLTISLVGKDRQVHDFVLSGKDYISPYLDSWAKEGECAIVVASISEGERAAIVLGNSFQRAFYSVFNADEMTISFANLAH